MASRPLHFIWLLDCSGSMGINGKITQLNYAIREAIPEMRKAADDNPGAELLVRALTFSAGAAWHLAEPTPVHDFTWDDVHTHSTTDLGAALRMVSEVLKTPPMPGRALRPVLALVSDGLPTDDWRSGLRAVDATPWGKRAVRVAIGIGEDSDRAMLKEFLANPEQEPLRVNNPKQLVAAIRWASTVAVATASTPTVGGDHQLAKPLDRAPTVTTGPAGGDDDVW
ncbi:vWA domain-containing protein [Streptomyces marincola]|uniref:vWA domain-containing protein n=1 Tax=Streptomyces marincola TaxID=2878388 RepID=UPI001CF1B406|nr:tellurium resistance protein [Streptomyces marincola]UCM87833.1 tellurium resistance protein [Streptomyces marincola]